MNSLHMQRIIICDDIIDFLYHLIMGAQQIMAKHDGVARIWKPNKQQWIPISECSSLHDLHGYCGQYYIPIDDVSANVLISRLQQNYQRLYCPKSRLWLIRDPFWHIILPMLQPECITINPHVPSTLWYFQGKYYNNCNRPMWKTTQQMEELLMFDQFLPVQSVEHMRSFLVDKRIHWMCVHTRSGGKIMVMINKQNIAMVSKNVD